MIFTILVDIISTAVVLGIVIRNTLRHKRFDFWNTLFYLLISVCPVLLAFLLSIAFSQNITDIVFEKEGTYIFTNSDDINAHNFIYEQNTLNRGSEELYLSHTHFVISDVEDVTMTRYKGVRFSKTSDYIFGFPSLYTYTVVEIPENLTSEYNAQIMKAEE